MIIFVIQCYSSIMKGERLGQENLISNNALYIILYAFFLFFILGNKFLKYNLRTNFFRVFDTRT